MCAGRCRLAWSWILAGSGHRTCRTQRNAGPWTTGRNSGLHRNRSWRAGGGRCRSRSWVRLRRGWRRASHLRRCSGGTDLRRCNWGTSRHGGRAHGGCSRGRSCRPERNSRSWSNGRRGRPRYLWLRRRLGCFRRSLGFGEPSEMLAGQLGVFDIDRARVCLFLRDADLGQIVDQHLDLDFKFSRQFVNSDLICVCHQPLF